jgi:hypothetical protein
VLVVAAAGLVGARGFIEALPREFDTDVRKRGLLAGDGEFATLHAAWRASLI